jgi:hypothetical protein
MGGCLCYFLYREPVDLQPVRQGLHSFPVGLSHSRAQHPADGKSEKEKAMKIAETDKYLIEIDKSKNRIYLTIKGFWKDVKDVPNYYSDWQRAMEEVTPGFTILMDAREMKTPTPEVAKLRVHAQKMVVDAGVRKMAELVPAGKTEQITLIRYAKESGMKTKSFENRDDSEAWLDIPND